MRSDEVPAGPILADTDVFSWTVWERGRSADFEPFLRGRVLALSFATVGELRAGALKARFGTERLEKMESAIGACVIIPATNQVVGHYAAIHARFESQFEQNDMWTAACALANNPDPLPIATGNLRHFQPIAREFSRLLLVHPDL